MATQWTSEDQQMWDTLITKSYAERSVNEEMQYKYLEAKRNLAAMKKRESIRKSGPLYWPAIIVMLAGIGSCVGAVDGNDPGLVGLGIGLMLLSSFLNWINSQMTGVD